MQGRAGKAPRREMVIESPQQYKSLAELEAEVEAGAQVAPAVSLFSVRGGCQTSRLNTGSATGTKVIRRFHNSS